MSANSKNSTPDTVSVPSSPSEVVVIYHLIAAGVGARYRVVGVVAVEHRVVITAATGDCIVTGVALYDVRGTVSRELVVTGATDDILYGRAVGDTEVVLPLENAPVSRHTAADVVGLADRGVVVVDRLDS